MRIEDFDLVRSIVKERSGLVLSEDKQYLVESRLAPIVRKQGLEDLAALVREVRGRPRDELMREITEAMTTNESLFFRDIMPFEHFRGVALPALLKARAQARQLRIWCAACSTGQEPYSLAMILKEEGARLAGWRVDVIGTDISTEVLAKARVGLYSQFEVQRGLPIKQLMTHFEQKDEMWQIHGSIRAMVQFREYNLLHDLASLGRFDVVLCRNVLIYFDNETKAKVLGRISRILAADGYLYLGGAETVLGITDAFAPLSGQRGVYGTTRTAA